METRWCPGCRAERAVEQPPCPDGHLECPERACVECGTAIVFGWLTDDLITLGAPQKRRRSSAA